MNINNACNTWRKSLVHQWISTLYVAVLGFVVSVFLARELGVEDFGNYSYILSLAGIFLIFQDGGYKTLIFRESVDDSSQALLSSGTLHVVLITVLGGLVVILLQPQHWLAILAAVSCMGLVALSGFVSSLLKGRGDFRTDAIWKMVIRSLTAVGIFWALFFYEDDSIIFLFVGWSMALLLALIWPVVKGYLKWPSFNFKSELFKDSMVFLTIDVATVFYFRSDIVLLEYYGNIEGDVGQYSAAYRILEGIILLATPVAMIAFRALRLHSKDKQRFFNLVWILLLSMLSVSTLIVVLGALWGGEFMAFVFGTSYLIAGALLPWLLLAMFFILPNYILTQGLIALNKEISYAKVVVWIAVLNITLNMVLIPDFGAMGAAWSTIIAEGLLCLGLSIILWKSRNQVGHAYRG